MNSLFGNMVTQAANVPTGAKPAHTSVTVKAPVPKEKGGDLLDFWVKNIQFNHMILKSLIKWYWWKIEDETDFEFRKFHVNIFFVLIFDL